MTQKGLSNIQTTRATQRTILEAELTADIYDTAPIKLAILENKISQGDYEANVDVPIIMNESENTQPRNKWRTYRERNSHLTKHRGQGFSLLIGQCTQLLQDKMNQDIEWNVVSTSYDPLTLYRMIKKTVLGQTEDQHPFATVYIQEFGFYAFRQDTLSNPHWYKRFNTKVDTR